MVKRTDRLYAVGELPELFVLPKKMHAWTLRTETLGEPISAFREEIVDVPQAGKGEVIVAMGCTGQTQKCGSRKRKLWRQKRRLPHMRLGSIRHRLRCWRRRDPLEDWGSCNSQRSSI